MFQMSRSSSFGISFAQVDGLDVLDGLDGLEWCDLEWNL